MKFFTHLVLATASLLAAETINASDTPKVQYLGYGEMRIHPDNGGKSSVSASYAPEFRFSLSPRTTFDLVVGFEYDSDADSDFKPEIDIEEAAFSTAWSEHLRTRIGKMHLPVGVYNLYHEPIYYHSVFPSEVEQKIIPDEWHENGAMAAYRIGGGELWGGIYSGLSQRKMSAGEWIRGTSLEGRLERPKSTAAVIRYDYGNIDEGTLVGGSIYRCGMSGFDAVGESSLTLWELHARESWDNGITIAAMFARGRATKTAELSSTLAEVIGKASQGWYVESAYDLVRTLPSAGAASLPVFVRHERFDTQSDVAGGLKSDPVNNRTVTTVGLNYRLSSNVVFKADYQFRSNGAGTERNRIEFGAGFVY